MNYKASSVMCSSHKTEQPLPSMEYRMAYMVVLFCFLIHMTVIGSDNELFHTLHHSAAIAMLLGQAVGYLFYPLLGWLADVYFTRYRLILFSFITVIVASVISITIASLSVIYVDSTVVNKASFIASGLCLIVGMIAVGLFACRTSCRNALNIPGSYASTHRHNWRSGV